MRTGKEVRMPGRSNIDWSLGLKSFSSGLCLLCPSSFRVEIPPYHSIYNVGKELCLQGGGVEIHNLVRGQHLKTCFTLLQEAVSPL